MEENTLIWWMSMCAVSVLNIGAWVVSAARVHHRQDGLSPDMRSYVRLQLLLSAGYVAGCAYRSVLPVYDVQRLCLVDSWMSSVIVGRSVATFAELCFAAQWALLLRRTAQRTGSDAGRWLSRCIVPMIVVAEVCSWRAVLTTSNLGHVFEETLWGLCAALLTASLTSIWPRCAPQARPLLVLYCVAGLLYVGYMFGVDVPMYWARWTADEAAGRHYLGIVQGVVDASTRWTASGLWSHWKTEVVWMSLYFSAAVWLSIALVHLPLPQRARPGAALVRPAPRHRAAASSS